MSLGVASRLWPVLGSLVLLIAGAVALELYAQAREPRAIVVAIRAQERQDLSGEDDGDGPTDELAAETGAPISPAHAAARELGRRGDLQGAIAAIEREIAADPARPELHADLGYLRLVEGRPSEAVQNLGRARDLGSNSPNTFLNLGVALRRIRDLAGAETALRRALELRPNFYSARLALATVMRRSRRFDEAIAATLRAPKR
jgi:Flp pilus assembly protein TadD